MKIAISQREIVLQNAIGMNLVFDGLERDWIKFLAGHKVITIPNTIDIDNFNFDCLILSGGPDSYARHKTENELYKLAINNNIPVIGICHGAFAINDLSGGVNGTCEGHIGTTHTVYMEQDSFVVNSYHSQSIDQLGPDMVVTAIDTKNNIEAFEHSSKPIYGIVWHPERMNDPVLPSKVKNLLKV